MGRRRALDQMGRTFDSLYYKQEPEDLLVVRSSAVASLKGFEYPFEVAGLADTDVPETVEDRDPDQRSDRWDRCHRSCLHEHHIPVLNTTSGLGQQSSFI